MLFIFIFFSCAIVAFVIVVPVLRTFVVFIAFLSYMSVIKAFLYRQRTASDYDEETFSDGPVFKSMNNREGV